jgi:hypothetical protein
MLSSGALNAPGERIGSRRALNRQRFPCPVQLRLKSTLTCEEYISHSAWLSANLVSCPVHARGGCRFRSCGTYERRRPAGLRIRRWYCPKAHRTFSLVPDFAASRISSSLHDIEQVAIEVERAREQTGYSLVLAARALRPNIEPEGAVRWVRRRLRWVEAALAVLMGLAPQLLAGCEPTLASVRAALGCGCVLVRAREIAAAQLAHLAAPVGFAPLAKRMRRRGKRRAHKTGPDPPCAQE